MPYLSDFIPPGEASMARSTFRTIPVAICGSALLASLVACGSEEDPTGPPPTADAGPVASAEDAGPVPEPELMLGTGERAFEPVADGHVLPLIRGHQGLQHVWISLRAQDFDPDRAIIALSLERESDGRPTTDAYRARLPFDVDPTGAFVERIGIQLVVPNPDLVLGQDLLLTAGIENPLGAQGMVSAHVTVQWEEDL
jgi:hypothetical protein